MSNQTVSQLVMGVWNNRYSLQEVEEHIIKYPSDINTAHDGRSVLMIACMHGDIELVELLLAHDVDINWVSYDSSSALDCALSRYDLGIVELLVSRAADIESYLSTAVMQACDNRDLEMLELVVRVGAGVNNRVPSISVYPALMLVISDIRTVTDVDIIKLLIGAGADINYSSQVNRTTALMLVCKALNRFVWSIRLIAVEKLHIEATALLLDAGADVDAQCVDGFSPLMYTLMRTPSPTAISTVKLLLDHRANTHLEDNQHQTALTYLERVNGNAHAQELRALLASV